MCNMNGKQGGNNTVGTKIGFFFKFKIPLGFVMLEILVQEGTPLCETIGAELSRIDAK